jgi:mono/diheme cytochrome c family protein
VSTVQRQPQSVRTHRRWPMLILGIVIGISVSGLLLLFVAMPYAISHRQNAPFERLYGDVAVSLATSRAAGDTQNPLAGNSSAITRGRIAYTGSCAVCHGATGDGRGSFGAALYPPATNLQIQATQGKTDAELFWIVKNGLSFLGMPAYADRYDDTDIWSLVAYMRTLAEDTRRGAQMPPAFTDEQLVSADPSGDAVARGSAIYFAQGCALCHGAIGNGTGTLQLLSSRGAEEAVRKGRRGMPKYDITKISQAELTDLIEYLKTLAIRQRG